MTALHYREPGVGNLKRGICIVRIRGSPRLHCLTNRRGLFRPRTMLLYDLNPARAS